MFLSLKTVKMQTKFFWQIFKSLYLEISHQHQLTTKKVFGCKFYHQFSFENFSTTFISILDRQAKLFTAKSLKHSFWFWTKNINYIMKSTKLAIQLSVNIPSWLNQAILSDDPLWCCNVSQYIAYNIRITTLQNNNYSNHITYNMHCTILLNNNWTNHNTKQQLHQ